MIDTHCHILPGIDDGPEQLEVALAMARQAVEDGIGAVIATPHMREGDYLNERDKVLQAVERFRAALQEQRIGLEIFPGSELHLAPRMAERVAEGRLLCYGDCRSFLLLECPYRTKPHRLEETIFELKLAGLTPVLAHPERIRYFQEEPEKYEQALRLGALGQLTSSSLLGTFGKSVQQFSERLVQRRMVHLLGTDAHDTEYRPVKLAAARSRWAELTDADSAERATSTWPRALLDGTPIDPPEPLPDPPRRGFFARLLGG